MGTWLVNDSKDIPVNLCIKFGTVDAYPASALGPTNRFPIGMRAATSLPVADSGANIERMRQPLATTRYDENCPARPASDVIADTDGFDPYSTNGFERTFVGTGAKAVHKGCPMYTYEKLPLASEPSVTRPLKCLVSVGTAKRLGMRAPMAPIAQGDTNAVM